jgi:hypothetical protein
VSWNVRDLVEAGYIHSRMVIRNSVIGGQDAADQLRAFEDSLEDTIYAQAAPMPHKFELKQIEAPQVQGAE